MLDSKIRKAMDYYTNAPGANDSEQGKGRNKEDTYFLLVNIIFC